MVVCVSPALRTGNKRSEEGAEIRSLGMPCAWDRGDNRGQRSHVLMQLRFIMKCEIGANLSLLLIKVSDTI